MLVTKLTEKTPDPYNVKEYHQSFLRRKNKTPGKRTKRITQQSKPIESPNIIVLKSVTIDHPKTSHKLSKTITWGKKISAVVGAGKNSNSLLYSETKITKQSHAKFF